LPAHRIVPANLFQPNGAPYLSRDQTSFQILLQRMDRPNDPVRTVTSLSLNHRGKVRKISPTTRPAAAHRGRRWVKRIPVAFPRASYRVIPVVITLLPSKNFGWRQSGKRRFVTGRSCRGRFLRRLSRGNVSRRDQAGA
jgi:hypothetical protein